MDANLDQNDPEMAAYLAMSRALEAIEHEPPARVAEMQWRQVARLAADAAAQSRFWRERLRPVFRNGAFDRAAWREIPILTRAEAQRESRAMRAASVPAADGIVYDGETSGSSGTPLHYTSTARAVMVSRVLTERLIDWHGLDPHSRTAAIRAGVGNYGVYPEGSVSQGWSMRAPEQTHHLLTVLTPLDQQLEWLGRVRPRYLITYPTNLRALADEARRSGARLALDAVLTVGELVQDETRALARQVFGSRLIDTYACEEVGKIALQCEVSGRYHICPTSASVEIVNPAGSPVRPGETGEVVVTGLHNRATFFLRYALGDCAVVAAAPCPCGRTLPTLERILGRTRSALILPGGGRFWVEEELVIAFRPHAPFRQFQIVQTAPDRIEFRYVPDGPARPPDEAAINAIASVIHPQMKVQAIAVTEIPRSAGGKYEDVVGLALPP